jgi:Ni/Co efflux regulator RcnB
MTTRHIAAGVIALLGFTAIAGAQARDGQPRGQAATVQKGQTQFNAQDRQATSSWSSQNQAHPPAGFRPQDRLSPDLESRLKVGSKLDPELQKRVHTVPTDLRRRLAAPAPSYRYVAVGGHVALLDKQNQVHDVIHVHS